MNKSILSDPDLIEDIDSILTTIFDTQHIVKQPHYVIEIGCHDGFFLSHTYNIIKSQCNRGKRLHDYPVDFIALTLSQNEREVIEKRLLGVPYKIAVIDDTNVSTILSTLKLLGIEDTRSALFVDLISDGNVTDFENLTDLNTQSGLIKLQSHKLETDDNENQTLDHTLPKTADEYLLDAARVGWFPLTGSSYCYPKSDPFARLTLNHFEHRHYHVRLASISDIPSLMKIEESSSVKPLRVEKDVIEKVIKDYPNGQLVIEMDGAIIGAAYSQRLLEVDSLIGTQVNSQVNLFDSTGSVINLISLKTLPQKKYPYLEDKCLEFFLQRALATNEITEVAVVLSCENYPGQDIISMESYVEELKQEKGSADLATKLHVQHGAEIKGCIPDYRPDDKRNLGYGVIVVYSRESRVPQIQTTPHETNFFAEVEITPQSIRSSVDEIIQRILLQTRNEKFSQDGYQRSKSFIELGLEQIQLLELRAMLCEEFSIDLDPNFFIRNNKPNSVIESIIERKLQPYRESLYEIEWQTSNKPQTHTLQPDKLWIIFSDEEEEITAPLRELLHENRQNCITVESGNAFEKISENKYVVENSSYEQLQKIISDISDFEKVEGVIYLSGCGMYYQEEGDPTLDTLESFHHTSLEGLVVLTNLLVSLKDVGTPKLWVVTKSLAADGSIASLAEWPLNGLCKIIREEYPNFRCCYVAINPLESPTEVCDTLFQELCSQTDENQVAFRKGQRLVPRMVRKNVEGVIIPKLSSKAFYLVAGGFRELGLQLAGWYTRHGAKHVILLDEIEITPEIRVGIDELKKQGNEILTFKVNLDDREALEKVFKTIESNLLPLKGLIHAAGIVDDDLLLHMNWDRFYPVHRLKVSLSWYLHELTRSLDLEHFILFSSCLPDIFPLGKANHATGVSFLDVLSHYRHKNGLPSLTINWGPWKVKHMVVRHLIERVKSDRIQMLEIEYGLQVLDHIFYEPKPQVTVATVNWPVFLHGMLGENPFFDEIAFEVGVKRVDLISKFMDSTQEERIKLVNSYVHEKVRRILHLKSSHLLETSRHFNEMGMDNAMMINLKNHIQFDLEEIVKFPFNFVEANPSIEKLSHAITKVLEEVVESNPVYKFKEPAAVIGKEKNTISLKVLNDKDFHFHIEDLSEELLLELNERYLKEKNKNKSVIIVVIPNQIEESEF